MRKTFLMLFSLFMITTSFWGGKGKVRDGVYYSAKKDFSLMIPSGIKIKVKEIRDQDQIVLIVESIFIGTYSLQFFKVPEDWLPFFEEDEELTLKKICDRGVVDRLRHYYPDAMVWVEKKTTIADSPAHFILLDTPREKMTLAGTTTKEFSTLNGGCVVRKGDYLFLAFVAVGEYLHPPDQERLEATEKGYLEDMRLMIESFQWKAKI